MNKIKDILMSKEIMSLIIMVAVIAVVIIINIAFKNNCINNGRKLIVGNNGYSCIYE